MKKLIFLLPLMGLVFSCSHKTTGNNETMKEDTSIVAGFSGTSPQGEVVEEVVASEPVMLPLNRVGMLPNATAFRMNGDYADNVAVTLDANGNLLYFPSPTDITENSIPLNLGNGWWLNRQGIGANSVFTKYTFKEYMELPSTPSIQELKASIIPNARVIEMIELPFKIGEASNNIEAVKEYLQNK